MIYILEGEEQVFIEHKITELLKQEDAEIVKFDGNSKDTNIHKIIDACTSNSLFSSKTIVLVKDACFLCKKCYDKELEELYDYVSNPSYDVDLILYTYDNKHNSKLKSFKEVLKNAQLLKFDTLDYKNFNTFVNQEVNRNQLNIKNDAINYLNSICKRDATLLIKNIEVLSNYPGQITTDVIEKLCTISDDNDAFEMINALTNKDISRTIYLERKLLKENDSVMSVIGLLSTQLRFLYQVSYLLSIKMKKSEILDTTKCSEYRYNKAIETLNRIDIRQIISLLNNLSKLDIECKTDNSLSDASRFELFILNLVKKDNYARD